MGTFHRRYLRRYCDCRLCQKANDDPRWTLKSFKRRRRSGWKKLVDRI